MECFIKKVFEKRADDSAHNQFVRFGKGIYNRRALISCHITSKIKLKASFEYANDFVNFVSEVANVNFSGIISSREELSGLEGKKKAGVYEYNVENIASSEIKKIREQTYYMLLDADGADIILKIKKKLPKPGKPAEKIDDKFCQMELDVKYKQQVQDVFFWDIGDFKKIKISHNYIITEIILPSGEKEPEKLRVLAKRKGKLIRNIEIDSREEKKEAELEA